MTVPGSATSPLLPPPLAPPTPAARALFAAARHQQLPVAVWRRPLAEAVETVVSLTAEVLAGLPPRLENGPAGFAFFPFRDSDPAPAFWLPAHVYGHGSGAEAHTPAAAAWLAALPLSAAGGQPAAPMAVDSPPFTADETFYRQLVAAGVALIQTGAVRKVVPSRAEIRALPDDFDAFTAFEKLCAAYPRAFVSLVSVPSHGQLWVGATPELLAEVAGGHTFRTVALAGTQPAAPNHGPEQARWGHKELEEQALVTRYIIGCFKQLRLREYDETGPRTVEAGGLWHLRTDFCVDLQQVTGYPALGTDMLRLLHPTSAVGGMPREAALTWLGQHEGYARTYYAGFLGPVNLPDAGTSALYVNLRCMQVLAGTRQAVLYAGGGLTAESDSAREWAETGWKLQVVANVVLGADA